MKPKRIQAALATLMSLALVISLIPAAAYADSSSTVLTLGADLTDEQQATVLEFFGLDESDLESMEVIYVTNEDEREYLEGTVSDSIIGTRTLSCSYIQLASSGGIEVETANLTYVTKNTIYNALQTAGIENCTVVVTAPFEVSGTGALTGIFLAVEADGTTLDEDKKEAATEELVATAELEEEYGEDVAEVISDVKDEVTSATEDLSTDEIEELVESTADEYGLSLSDDDAATITSLIETIQQLDYDTNAFSDTLSSINDNATGIFAAIKSFFSSIVDFFKGLFGGGSSIIDGLDTDVFELDSTDSSSDTAESSSTDASSSSDDESSSDSSDATTFAESSDEEDDSEATEATETTEDAESESSEADDDAATADDASTEADEADASTE